VWFFFDNVAFTNPTCDKVQGLNQANMAFTISHGVITPMVACPLVWTSCNFLIEFCLLLWCVKKIYHFNNWNTCLLLSNEQTNDI